MSQYFTFWGGISRICAHFATNEPLFLSIIGLFPFGTKGDKNVRGHIGTEMNNKAEAVLLIDTNASNPDISEVKPLYNRGKFSLFIARYFSRCFARSAIFTPFRAK